MHILRYFQQVSVPFRLISLSSLGSQTSAFPMSDSMVIFVIYDIRPNFPLEIKSTDWIKDVKAKIEDCE
jgi:hypothetical protein